MGDGRVMVAAAAAAAVDDADKLINLLAGSDIRAAHHEGRRIGCQTNSTTAAASQFSKNEGGRPSY